MTTAETLTTWEADQQNLGALRRLDEARATLAAAEAAEADARANHGLHPDQDTNAALSTARKATAKARDALATCESAARVAAATALAVQKAVDEGRRRQVNLEALAHREIGAQLKSEIADTVAGMLTTLDELNRKAQEWSSTADSIRAAGGNTGRDPYPLRTFQPLWIGLRADLKKLASNYQ